MIANPGPPEEVFNVTSSSLPPLVFTTNSVGHPSKSFVLVFISPRENSQADHEIHNRGEFINIVIRFWLSKKWKSSL